MNAEHLKESATRMATVVVAQRYTKVDGGLAAYAEENPRASARVAEAEFVGKCVYEFAVVAIEHETRRLAFELRQERLSVEQIRAFCAELLPVFERPAAFDPGHYDAKVRRLRSFVETGLLGLEKLPPKGGPRG